MAKARKRGRQAEAKRIAPKFAGKCFNCKKDVTQDDYCYGCSSYVCDGCDERGANGAAGIHLPEDHLGPA